MIKTIFFDFDGVVTIDTKGSISFANYIVEKTGIDQAFFLEKYREFGNDLLTGKSSHLEIWPELCRQLGIAIDPILIEAAFSATPINMAVIDLITQLKAANYQVGLITDNKSDRMKTIIQDYHWQELFDVLAISAHVGSRKSAPAIYHYALTEAGIKADEAIFIDNTLKNLVIPQEIGYHTLYFDDKKKDVDLLLNQLVQLGVTL